jgi:hypothetical protein
MFWCDKCGIWQHEACLVKAVRKDLVKQSTGPSTSINKPVRLNATKFDISIAADPKTGQVTARVAEKPSTNKSDRNNESKDGTDYSITIVPVLCLKCGVQLK